MRKQNKSVFAALRNLFAWIYPFALEGLSSYEKVERWIPPETKRVYAVIDNLFMYNAYDVMLFSLAYPRWEFDFHPNDAAYLNLSESRWKTLRYLALKSRHFEDWTEMIEPVRQCTAYQNEQKLPYVWSKRRRHRRRYKLGIAALPTVDDSFVSNAK